MVTIADITAGLAAAEAIVNAIVRAAPAIEQGVVSSLPYVQAIAGLIQGTNATQQQIDDTLNSINAASDLFLEPLPPDDGTTTT
ncbi:MAG: hypothetical protein EKK40_15700 [Bradyrhizobiaceae bacterium]|nr:MAG: hypothetical protein EKK40_15700 [Bradyrhizobiaceae bacterium]